MSLTVRPRTVLTALLAIALCLVLLHELAFLVLFKPDASYLRTAVLRILNLDQESGLGVWWSVLQLTAASVVAALVAVHARRHGKPWVGWLVIAVVLLWMGFDEEAAVHEVAAAPVQAALGVTSGPLLAAWVIPSLAAVVVVIVALSRFAMRLPRRTVLRLALAALVFVTGSVGMELLNTGLLSADARGEASNHLWMGLIGAEEGLELAGVALCIWAMLRHLVETAPDERDALVVVGLADRAPSA